MATGEIEHAYVCPYCWERSLLLVDLSESGEQRFIQDCEVCCNPIEFTVQVANADIQYFSSRPANE